TQPSDAKQLAQALWQLIQHVCASLEQERTFTETLTLLEEAIITLDSSGNILEYSTGWLRLTRAVSPTGERFIGYVHPDDREGWLAKTAQLHENAKDLIHVRFRLNTAGNSHPWVEGKFLCHTTADNQSLLRGALRDVTQSYLHEKQITHMALHDALTGIANRILLEDRLKQAIQLADRHQRQLAILFFDLDHFKQINDSLGHKVGDQLLIAVSQRIQSQIRAGDTLARWGGDEFVILFSDMEAEKITSITEKLLQTMQTPFKLEEHELSISYSMGIAIYPQDAQDIQGLFANADRAMFHAKSQGRNQICFYADMNCKENGKHELYIQNRLVEAIKRKQIDVYYQPIIDAQNNRIISVEALARWQDERYGSVSPETFIPMVENNGLTCQFGEHIIQQALQTLVAWRDQGIHVSVAINVSTRQLFSPSFISNLLYITNQHGLLTSDLVLEVTESLALRDVDHAIDNLIELRKHGFKVSIDDFGTGHSSLAQLQEISADKLKIDRRFIHRLNTEKGYTMVKAIQNMAYALGLKTVAEGVETATQQMIVKQLGISYIQGYYYAKPMDAQHCFDWIKEHNDKLKTM
ncbi:MAG: EAL domain-containing protein, partial [Gammaproteobacteria bacterium]|nr:EAL domain-containing protein [Gammaproteobacteria bacterium]